MEGGGGGGVVRVTGGGVVRVAGGGGCVVGRPLTCNIDEERIKSRFMTGHMIRKCLSLFLLSPLSTKLLFPVFVL